MKDGILIVNKPSDISSFGIVKKIKKISEGKKVGHLGTLDPKATGVLPIMIGKATRLAKFYENNSKEYIAEMLIGIETDSQDIWGKTINTSDNLPDDNEIKRTLLSFKGVIDQIPPMASALKVNGKRLYKYFRENIEVERKSRKIKIISIELLNIKREDELIVKFKVNCSKGSYIRTLCDDIGKKMNTFATMSSLKRIANGVFFIEDSINLEKIIGDNIELDKKIIPIIDLLPEFPKINIEKELLKDVYNGCSIEKNISNEEKYFKIIYENRLLGIYKNNNSVLNAEIVFHYE